MIFAIVEFHPLNDMIAESRDAIKNRRIQPPVPVGHPAIGRKPAGRHSRIIITTATLPGKWQA